MPAPAFGPAAVAAAAERLRDNPAELAAVRRRLGELAPHAPGGPIRALGRTGAAHHPLGCPAPDAEPSEKSDGESDLRLRLSEGELAEAYELILREHLVERAERDPSERPIAVVVAGQPGSGKGQLGERAFERLVEAGRAPVHVDTDLLRAYHREYPRLVAEDAKHDPLAERRGLEHNAASLVQPEAGRWRGQLS